MKSPKSRDLRRLFGVKQMRYDEQSVNPMHVYDGDETVECCFPHELLFLARTNDCPQYPLNADQLHSIYIVC